MQYGAQTERMWLEAQHSRWCISLSRAHFFRAAFVRSGLRGGCGAGLGWTGLCSAAAFAGSTTKCGTRLARDINCHHDFHANSRCLWSTIVSVLTLFELLLRYTPFQIQVRRCRGGRLRGLTKLCALGKRRYLHASPSVLPHFQNYGHPGSQDRPQRVQGVE